MTPAPSSSDSVGEHSTPTFVSGLDFILGGGVPAERTTLLVGGPGTGKSILASEFILRGAAEGEPGLFVSFDETPAQIAQDLSSLELGLADRLEEGSAAIHHVDPADARVASVGDFTLDGLFLQLESRLDELGGARRLALDSLESFFAATPHRGLLRAELIRLFRWLGERRVTTVVTAEKGSSGITRLGLEEYLTDCVILLRYEVEERIATRRARVLKRRGGSHDGDEHPFLISRQGIHLFPLARSRLSHSPPRERVSTGIESLDALLGGEGLYRGSSVLVSGTPGAGKSSVAAAFVDGACRRGERAVYFAFEESPDQIVRNMASVGYDLAPWVEEGRLHIRAQRPTERGLEHHLMEMYGALEDLTPDVAVLDPFTSLTGIGFEGTTRSMMVRLVDRLKLEDVTALYTSLTTDSDEQGSRQESVISSLMDAWLVLESRRDRGTLTRYLWIRKSRGMGHSRELHELAMDETGLVVLPAPEDTSSRER